MRILHRQAMVYSSDHPASSHALAMSNWSLGTQVPELTPELLVAVSPGSQVLVWAEAKSVGTRNSAPPKTAAAQTRRRRKTAAARFIAPSPRRVSSKFSGGGGGGGGVNVVVMAAQMRGVAFKRVRE